MMESNFRPPLNGHLRGCRSFGVKIRGMGLVLLVLHLALHRALRQPDIALTTSPNAQLSLSHGHGVNQCQ